MEKKGSNHPGGKIEEQETRQKILSAARHLMSQKGFKGATTRLIAEEAGVNEVTIFRHFGNKEGLIHYMLEEVSTIHPQLEAINPDDYPTVREFLIKYGEAFYQALMERKEILLISFIEAKNLSDEAHCIFYKLPKSAIMVLAAKLEQLFEQDKVNECDFVVAAHMYISSSYSAFVVRYQAGAGEFDLELERLLVSSVEILMQGLQKS